MKPREYKKLNAYHGMATALVKRIQNLDSFLRGLRYRLKENPAAELEVTVRRARIGRAWDTGATMKLPVQIVGKLLLPIVKRELSEAKTELRELPPIKTEGWKAMKS